MKVISEISYCCNECDYEFERHWVSLSETKEKGIECPECESSDEIIRGDPFNAGIAEGDYHHSYWCNKCGCRVEWNWTDSWGEDNADNFRSAELKKRKISINEGRCYFCNRTEKDWAGIHNEIIANLKKEQDSIKGGSDSHSKQAKEAISSFKKIWSKVNGRHKVSTLMSDPLEFLPEEISKYWSDDWDDYSRYERGASRGPFADYFENIKFDDGAIGADSNAWQYHHPEWFSLERLCLDWLYKYHTDDHLAVAMRTREEKKNKDVRVNKIEKKMLKKITKKFEENYGRKQNTGYGEPESLNAGEKITVNSMLIERLISLQEGHSSLRRFTWKPWSENDIRGGDGEDSSRSKVLAVDTWICPMCYDRFQMKQDEW